MKRRINSDIKSHLIRNTSYTLLLALAVCVIPLALAQRNTTKTKRRQAEMGHAFPANTIVVTNTSDSGPGSLRDALAIANDGDTIDATGISGTISLTSGELLVDTSVTINGAGADVLAVDGNMGSRVFRIPMSGETVTISGF